MCAPKSCDSPKCTTVVSMLPSSLPRAAMDRQSAMEPENGSWSPCCSREAPAAHRAVRAACCSSSCRRWCGEVRRRCDATRCRGYCDRRRCRVPIRCPLRAMRRASVPPLQDSASASCAVLAHGVPPQTSPWNLRPVKAGDGCLTRGGGAPAAPAARCAAVSPSGCAAAAEQLLPPCAVKPGPRPLGAGASPPREASFESGLADR